jgi:hypothetical protein
MNQPHAPHNNNSVEPCECGEGRPDAITQGGRGPCYECSPTRIGSKQTEQHHPFGRYNKDVRKITVEIPGNWHRVLDALRSKRPAILKRPGEEPLHQIAAIVVTIAEAVEAFSDFARRQQWPDWIAMLADVFAHAGHLAADWLLILAGKLDARLGPTWTAD